MEAPEDRHALESLGHGSLWSLIGQIGLIVSIFAVRVLLVRVVGTSVYGELAIGTAISSILTSIGGLGVSTAVARQLAHTLDPAERRGIVRSSLIITIPAALSAGLFMALAAPEMASALHNTALVPVFQYYALVTVMGLVTAILASYFQGIEDVRPNTIFNQILNPALNFAFIYLFLVVGWGLTGALLGYVAADVVVLAGIVVYTAPRMKTILRGKRQALDADEAAPARSVGTVKSLLLFALPLALVALAQGAPGTADSVVLQLYTNVTAVGDYNSVLPLARLISLAVTSLAFIMLPVSSRLHRDGNMEELRASYVTITKWILLVSLPLYLIFLFFPGPSLVLVYGAGPKTPIAYSGTTTALMITATGTFIYALLGASPSVLVGLGHLRWLVYDTVVSAVIDVVGTFALAPSLGLIGAAIAFAGATVSLPLLCVFEIHALAGVHPFKGPVLRPLLAVGLPVGGVFAFAVMVLHWSPAWYWLVLLFFAVAGLYFLAIPATRSLELEDRHLLSVAEFYLGRRIPFVRKLLWPFVPPAKTAVTTPGSPPRSP